MEEQKLKSGKSHMETPWHELVDNKLSFVYAVKEIPCRSEYYIG